MSSRNRKKISTRKKKLIYDDLHLETKKIVLSDNVIKIPEFKDLKIEMDIIKAKETDLKNEKQNVIYKSNDKYLCEDCNIYLLYKNINRHTKTKTHIMKQ